MGNTLLKDTPFPRLDLKKTGTIYSLADFRSDNENESIIQRLVDHQGPRSFYKQLSADERVGLLYLWEAWARSEQLAPALEWFTWIYMAGRGSGKTRSGAEWVRKQAESGTVKRIGLIASTVSDYRDTMIEGESGILSVSPPWFYPIWEPSKRKLTWPNGCVAYCFSSEKPDRLRGPQFEKIWADELAAWNRLEETFDNMMFGLRLGDPQLMITTTPRPLKILKDLLKEDTTVLSKGSTYDNIRNLSPRFFEYVINKYEGTRIGRQEIHAEILDDNPNALFQRDDIEANRIEPKDLPELDRVCIPVDPAATSGEKSNDTGIVPVGIKKISGLEHFYILGDHTCHLKPDGWGRQVLKAYHYHKANYVAGETNNGGEMVEHVIKTCQIKVKEYSEKGKPVRAFTLFGRNVPFKEVRATRGKVKRAEPIGALSEQGRIHFVGRLPKVEDECCEWDPSDPSEESPDRLDSLVWGVTSLMTQSATVYVA